MSMTRSSRGREPQGTKLPSARGSSGSELYFTDPEINPHSQVWQTPVWQDQRVRTSQASASSNPCLPSRFWSMCFLLVKFVVIVSVSPRPGRRGSGHRAACYIWSTDAVATPISVATASTACRATLRSTRPSDVKQGPM